MTSASWMQTVITVFLTVACSLSILGTSLCDFARFPREVGLDILMPRNIEIGFWGRSGYTYWRNYEGIWQVGVCYAYTEKNTEVFDSAFTAARVFSILTPIFALVTSLILCSAGYQPRMMKLLCIPLLLTTLFSGLTLLIFSSAVCDTNNWAWPEYFKRQSCELGSGGIVVIVNTILFFLSTVMLFFMARALESSSEEVPEYIPGDSAAIEAAKDDEEVPEAPMEEEVAVAKEEE
mmetsp:Transcript_18548/g.28035  ORF Transcript_18548/g.28035 Transcript_18548/m.28035 type:complete len:235 (-) Transcript_18548:205-909(-)|eukprot:CAMPEP_0178911152 /NCGR_PEP_ID=MMETSP0786-20121207/9519_1 /TAXON_ID=186022 /ORGANISM="Thalassionema frauenfeldii, Strain CCMP 1798" /LENGTH=234 /DNA_ID=CAMNT_0020583533 /DNA_START=26 /DNA_END=730 /DNA_ORIENTATION=+